MTIGILLLAVFANGAERSLPRGENDPKMISKVFSCAAGEVQFLEMKSGSTAFLKDKNGNLIGLHEVRGSAPCHKWFISKKDEDLPSDCTFVFADALGALTKVTSVEMGRGENVAL